MHPGGPPCTEANLDAPECTGPCEQGSLQLPAVTSLDISFDPLAHSVSARAIPSVLGKVLATILPNLRALDMSGVAGSTGYADFPR